MKNFFYLLFLTSFLITPIQVNADITDNFRSLFQARYNAFTNPPIRSFLGSYDDFLSECWAHYCDNYENNNTSSLRLNIDDTIDNHLNARISAAIDAIIAEIESFFGVNLSDEGWRDDITWAEIKAEMIEIFRRDLELEDNPNLRGDLADYCDVLQQLHFADGSDSTLLEIAAHLRGEEFHPQS